MNPWIKTMIIILLVIGAIWCITGICAAFKIMDREPDKSPYGQKPNLMEALLAFVACFSAAGLSWLLAVSLYLFANLSQSITRLNEVRVMIVNEKQHPKS